MPICFDLESLRKEHNCVNYFETGLWDPRDDVSSKKALSCGFDKVYCIEIKKDFVNLGLEVFKEDINTGRYNLYLDDSTNIKKYLTSDNFKHKTMFFLDAHIQDFDPQYYNKRCPLFEELEAIKTMGRNDNIILIDDLRIISSFFWHEKSYGNINFLQNTRILFYFSTVQLL